MQLVGVDARQQGHHVCHILRNLVVLGIGQAPAVAAAYYIGADHTICATHRASQIVEVAAHPRQTMRAEQYLRISRITPFGIGHPVQAGG